MAEAEKGQLEKTTEALEVPQEITKANETSHGDDARRAIEDAAMAKNAEIPVVDEFEETEATPTPAKDKAEVEQTPEESSNHVDRIKKSVQKRIDKITAKTKSLEEQLAEKDAEIERLRSGEQKPKEEVVEKREPTMEECRKALAKAYNDQDWEFAAQVTEYMAEAKAKAQRLEAEKSYSENTTKQTAATQKQQADWISLNRDYEVVDETGNVDLTHDMSLANQNGELYKTALDLFKSPETKGRYAGQDTILGFRLAVNDAYRGLIEQGYYQPLNKKVGKETLKKVNAKAQLAVPDAEGSDEAPVVHSPIMSNAEKAREEIKYRMAHQNKRMSF